MKVAELSIERTPQLLELIQFLDSLPDDEILTSDEVMNRFPIRPKTLREWALNKPKLSFHCFKLPAGATGFYVYGNPRAIIATRKHITKTLGGK